MVFSNLVNCKIECHQNMKQIKEDERFTMLQILESNMKAIYEKTWGWNLQSKSNELFSNTSKFIICREIGSNEIMGYCVYKFEWDDMDEPEFSVLFCYELQIDIKFARLGLGKMMMSMLIKIEQNFIFYIR